VLGVFRTPGGAVRAIVQSGSATNLWERTDDQTWTQGAAITQPITDVGALDQVGFLAACGSDKHLCAGTTGEDLAPLPLPTGEVFAGVHAAKPLYFGNTADDVVVLAAGPSILRRRGGAFVKDALPAAYSVVGRNVAGGGFLRAHGATYLYLPHSAGTAQVTSTFRLAGECWQWVSAPAAGLAWGASDGTLHFYDSQNNDLCTLTIP
jgi:hypothetical protein